VAISMIDLANWLGSLGRWGVICRPVLASFQREGRRRGVVPLNHNLMALLTGGPIVVARRETANRDRVDCAAMRTGEIVPGTGFPSLYHFRNMRWKLSTFHPGTLPQLN
jgi:hypothetical protein